MPARTRKKKPAAQRGAMRAARYTTGVPMVRRSGDGVNGWSPSLPGKCLAIDNQLGSLLRHLEGKGQ
jgi:hypothetical protein